MANVIDLFAGAGGLSLGAARAGFSVIGAVELDKNAIQTHKNNFPKAIHIQEDVMKLTGKGLLKMLNLTNIDGVIGGPPCQGFSNMGQGDVNDVRNKLFIQFFNLVSQLRPKFFVAENVPGILNTKYDKIRKKAFRHVSDYILLPPLEIIANEYGAPTTRKRIFFIGYLPNVFQSLSVDEFEAKKIPTEEQMHVCEALKGLPQDIEYKKNTTGEYHIESSCIKDMLKSNNFYFSRVVGVIPKNVGNTECINRLKFKNIVTGLYPTNHSPEIVERYAKLENGKQDKISKSQKLRADGFCPTLRAGTGPDKGSYQAVRPIHYHSPRVITPREAARLQGFPDWFLLPNTIWHSFRQIGNSVSPLVAERILSVLSAKL